MGADERAHKLHVEQHEKADESLRQLNDETSVWRERCMESEALLNSVKEGENALKQRQEQDDGSERNPFSDAEADDNQTEVAQLGSKPPSPPHSQPSSQHASPHAPQININSPKSTERAPCSESNFSAEPEHCRHVSGNPFEAPEDSHPCSGYASAAEDQEDLNKAVHAPQEGADNAAPARVLSAFSTEEPDHNSTGEAEDTPPSPESPSSNPPSKTEEDPQSEDTAAPGTNSITADPAEAESSQTSEDSSSPVAARG